MTTKTRTKAKTSEAKTVPVAIRNVEGWVIYTAQVPATVPKQDRLKHAVVQAVRQRVSLRLAMLRDAHLEGAWLEGADLREARLSGANLDNANLRGACLAGADLTDARATYVCLAKADLRRALLGGSVLCCANLSGARLEDAVFGLADLFGADLTGANLGRINMHCNRISDAALVSGSVWHGVKVRRIAKIITRLDGYRFHLLQCEDGIWRVTAGCRFFTLDAAWEHWTRTRGDNTLLGSETLDILWLFDEHIKRIEAREKPTKRTKAGTATGRTRR